MVRYLLAALLLRVVDAGTTIGLVLLCAVEPGIDDPIRTAGLLGAALTAPHLTGALTSRWLDRATDPKKIVAVAGFAYAVLLAAAVLLLGRVPLLVVAILVALAGFCGPMLTGGLSALLPELPGGVSARRRSSLDATTYGVTGSAGPAVVTVLAALVSPLAALVALVSCAVAGAVVTLLLPTAARTVRPEHTAGLRTVAAAIWRRPRLRRLSLLTWIAAFAAAGLVLTGIGRLTRTSPDQAGWIAVGFGVGLLVGGTLLILRPARGSTDRGLLFSTAAMLPLGAVVLLVDGAPLLVAAFVALGLLTAVQATFSLAGRAESSDADDRAGVFMGVSGVKIAFSSAGTAVAGLLSGAPIAILLAVFLGPVLLTTLWAGWERRRNRIESTRPRARLAVGQL